MNFPTLLIICRGFFINCFTFVCSISDRMVKYNKNFLKKLVGLLAEANYKVRFEKGNFISGHVVVLQKNIIVVNRFLAIDMKINALLDIMYELKIEKNYLSPNSRKTYVQLIKTGILKNNFKKSENEEE